MLGATPKWFFSSFQATRTRSRHRCADIPVLLRPLGNSTSRDGGRSPSSGLPTVSMNACACLAGDGQGPYFLSTSGLGKRRNRYAPRMIPALLILGHSVANAGSLNAPQFASKIAKLIGLRPWPSPSPESCSVVAVGIESEKQGSVSTLNQRRGWSCH